MADKDTRKYVYPIPGSVRGYPYIVRQPKTELGNENRPNRPIFTGSCAFIDHRDINETQIGTRYFGYLLQAEGNPEIYHVVKMEGKNFREQALDTVTKAIEDMRVIMLLNEGETGLSDNDFFQGLITKGYNRTISVMVGSMSRASSRMEMRFLYALALSGLITWEKACKETFIDAIIREFELSGPESRKTMQALINLKSQVGAIREYVHRHRHDKNVAIEAAKAFRALFEMEATNATGSKFGFSDGLQADHPLNAYQKVPKEDGSYYESFGNYSLTEKRMFEKNEKGIIKQLMTEGKGSDLSGLKGVTFEMKVLRMPIMHHRSTGKHKIASDFGIVPRYIERYSFGPMFSIKGKAPKGVSVLIDNSGSMSIKQESIAQICKEIPAATIGTYNSDGYLGRLYVIAKDGKMASDDEILRASVGGANVVDSHSLLWLERQNGPRIWVSDGGVTGRGDTHQPGVTAFCQKIQKRGKIARVGNMAKLMEVLRRGGLLK